MGFWNDYRLMRSNLKSAKEALKISREIYKASPTKDNESAMIEAKQVVILVIAIFIIAALLPSAISMLNSTNQTGWSAVQVALFGLVGVIVIAAIIMKIIE